MGGHYITSRASSADWAWRVAAFSTLVLPLSVVFFRLRLLDLPTLTWSLGVAAGGLAAGLLIAIYAMARIWTLGEEGGGRSVAAFVLGVAASAPIALAAYLFTQAPLGNSAQTAGFGLSRTVAAPASPEASVLPGRDFQATASIVYGAVRTALAARGMEITDVATATTPEIGSEDLGVAGAFGIPVPTSRDSVDRTRPYDPLAELDSDEYVIQAVAFAPLLAVPSDVVIRIVEEDGETYVDLRSTSRTLENDGGINRRIVQGFLVSLQDAMNVLEGVTGDD